MSSAVSAPWARASSSWYESMIKSLRSTQTPGERRAASSAARTAARSSSEPLNHVGSVRTETVHAPATAYARACCAASVSAAMSPLEGEARFISASRPIGAAPRSVAQKSSAGARAAMQARSSADGMRSSASATSRRRCRTTLSRIDGSAEEDILASAARTTRTGHAQRAPEDNRKLWTAGRRRRGRCASWL